jgi:hypothetical protein
MIGCARPQVDFKLSLQLDDAGGELDQPQPQYIELQDAPDRAFGYETAHQPKEA